VRRAAVLVADVAGVQPFVEQTAVTVVGDRVLTAGVRLERREQVRVPAGPAVRDALLLAADRGWV
jgi:hypothetical protein